MANGLTRTEKFVEIFLAFLAGVALLGGGYMAVQTWDMHQDGSPFIAYAMMAAIVCLIIDQKVVRKRTWEDFSGIERLDE